MSNAKKSPAKVAVAKVAAPVASNSPASALFAAANAPVTAQSLRAWVNANAGGNWSKVTVVVQPSVATDWEKQGLKGPVPFGYNGGGLGPRATLQNKALASSTVAEFMAWSKGHPLGGYVETPNRPHTLLALLNGGYSPSSKTWCQSFIHLAVA